MVRPSCSAPSTSVETVVGVLLALECGLGLPGHAAALWTFFHLEVWKPYTVYLLSLLLTACLPFHAAFYLRHRAWGLSLMSCQALLCLLLLSCGVGVACDRYLCSPELHRVAQLLPSTTGQEVLFFLQILLPFGLISFGNASIIRPLQRRTRVSHQQPRLRRAKVLVTAVLLLLGLCFLPSVLSRVLMHTLQGSQSCSVLRSRCTWPRCTHLHSVLNPAVYFSNPAFTHSYQKVFSSLRGRRQAAEPPELLS
ncbi:12-(S)-hydroxy-5,8,10,14-eicosatetraenoic acid receptor [Urocitellus parryii]